MTENRISQTTGSILLDSAITNLRSQEKLGARYATDLTKTDLKSLFTSLIQVGQKKYPGLSINPRVDVNISNGIATINGDIFISHPILGSNKAKIDYSITNDAKVDGYVKSGHLITTVDMSIQAQLLASTNGLDPERMLKENLEKPQIALSNLFRNKLPRFGLELKGLGVRISKNTNDTINLVLITDPIQG